MFLHSGLLLVSFSFFSPHARGAEPLDGSLAARAANPACLKTVELSCLNLAANCIDSVTQSNKNNIWSIRSCAAAGTCYGVGDLIASVNCQIGANLVNSDEAALDYNIYAGIVGSCAWATGGCSITQQQYIDWFYGTLTLINTANWPASANVVIGFFNTVKTWTATGTTIPYMNFNDWYHYSSYPPVQTTTSVAPQFTAVPWNPNPVPSPGAVSQTFVKGAFTTIIEVPTTTRTIVVVDVTLTLAPGGTPIRTIVPPDVTQPNAITPVFNWNPKIPPTATSATFTSGTWTSIVAVPTTTNVQVTVQGPPDDGNDDDDDDSWLIIFAVLGGPTIIGTIPATVKIVGGIIPTPVPPPDWPDNTPWVAPVPPPGGDGDDPDDDPDDPDEPEVCNLATMPDHWGDYDPSGEEPEDEDLILQTRAYQNLTEEKRAHLFKRAARHIVLGRCTNSQPQNSPALGFTDWYTLDPSATPLATDFTTMATIPNTRHVVGVKPGKIKEHIFELRYIKDFVDQGLSDISCTWLSDNMWTNIFTGTTPVSVSLLQAIDQIDNFVWASVEINRAKSWLINNQVGTSQNPPLGPKIAQLTSIESTVNARTKALYIETHIRSLGILGQYLTANAARYRRSAQRVQDILSRITPATPIFPPLDERFNTFLRNTVAGYSQGITTRADNMLTAYKNRVDTLLTTARVAAQTAQPPEPEPNVPNCWAVYHSPSIGIRLLNGGIDSNSFAIPALVHPTCNTAGTSGLMKVRTLADGTAIGPAAGPTTTAQLTATGTAYYGIKLSNATVTLNFYDIDASTVFGGACNGQHVVRALASSPAPIAKWDQQCPNANRAKANSDLFLSVNDVRQVCRLNSLNFELFCGPTPASVNTCITAAQGGAANATSIASTLRFLPTLP